MKLITEVLFIVFVVSFACGAYLDELPVKMQNALTVCKSEMNLTDHDIEQILSATDSEHSCVHACLLKKLGAMDSNGALDIVVIESLAKEMKSPEMTDEFVTRLVLHCAEDVKSNTDECAVASTFMKCATDKDHVI